ncbi:MAG: hypothetical protein QOD42_1315 [Sphingomonadales bacterium]|nr:hypothetical protein [Sphingomonadales bacterium]
MRMLAIALAAGAALLAQPVSACVVAIGAEEPPPANAAERRALRQRMAEHQRFLSRQAIDSYRRAAALIEVEVLEVPDWRRPIRMRVTAVYKGDFNPGDDFALAQEPPYNCGGLFREPLNPGMRVLLQLRQAGNPPSYQFTGFLPQDQLRMLRENRVLLSPRR